MADTRDSKVVGLGQLTTLYKVAGEIVSWDILSNFVFILRHKEPLEGSEEWEGWVQGAV